MSTYGGNVTGRRVTDDDVAKGLRRQSVMPVIARVNPQRSFKRTVTGDAENVRRVIGKGLGTMLGGELAANAIFRGGMSDKKALALAAGGSAALIGGAEVAGRKVGSNRYKSGKHVNDGFFMGPSVNRGYFAAERKAKGKLYGAARKGPAEADRSVRKDDVAKFGFKGLGAAAKSPGAIFRGAKVEGTKVGRIGGIGAGWRAGRSGATGLASPANAGARLGQNVGMALGRNPVATGAAGGALGMGALTAGNGMNNRYKPQPMMPPPMYGGFGKAFSGPVKRAGSYAEWAAGHGKPSGLGAGPKTLERAKSKAKFGAPPSSPEGRAASLWQRDNNMKGSWVGNAPAGHHVSLDDARWNSGVYGLNTAQQRKLATAERRGREGKKVSPVKARRGVANDLEMYEHPDDFTSRVRRGQFKKRHYDPEGERRYRQGAAAAASGIGGVALLRSGGKTVREDTRYTRQVAESNPVGKLPGRAAEQASKTRVKMISGLPKGVVLTRRGGGKVAGGVALLGTSGALFRNRNEERWD